MPSFQSTPPRGATRRRRGDRAVRFQSTPPRGRATQVQGRHDPSLGGFNPRPRVGRATARPSHSALRASRFQSTPPRGRPVLSREVFEPHLRWVSIHAPAWGRRQDTAASISPSRCKSFNPRPRVGATNRDAGGHDATGFNPRPRGGRRRKPWTLCAGRFQSTPAWGATLGGRSGTSSAVRFQSTPPRGGRRRRAPPVYFTCEFQSTPPRGGRRPTARETVGSWLEGFQSTPPRGATTDSTAAAGSRGFNPRPRVGGDRPAIRGAPAPSNLGFNPRPRVGATTSLRFGGFSVSPSVGTGDVSIHAPAWRATTPRVEVRRSTLMRFNPRPRVGGDRVPRHEVLACDHGFNPRPRVGGRLSRVAPPADRGAGFNPRPRVGGDETKSGLGSRFLPGFNPRPRV